jgi:cytochrome c oxidase cbb3-type subunit 3
MRHISILFPGVLACALIGCDQRTAPPPDLGGAGALSMRTQGPVGPVPGPGAEPVEKTGPYRDDAAAIRDGRTLFVRYNCSGCHGGRAGGGMGPSLRDEDWMYGHSDADVFDSIAQGRAHGMPAWGTRVPEDQIWRLVAYIDSLRTPQEPDAP